jgi:hypothetical protein
MSTIRNAQSRSAIGHVLHILVWCALLTGATYAQEKQSQPEKLTYGIDKANVPDVIEKARQDDDGSIYYVEQLAHARAVQAVPMLEEKFVRTEDALNKAHIASALVRLGDKNDIYWDFLVKQATQAVESDAPNFLSYDSQGKAVGPSPEFEAWVKAHNLSPTGLWEKQMYLAPGPLAFLALTGDPRAVPVLRRGLLSPNYQIEITAALGLAKMGAKGSVPLIVDACKKAPADAAEAIAEALVYFDDPEAQSAVDKYIPKDSAKIYREARANGRKPFGN